MHTHIDSPSSIRLSEAYDKLEDIKDLFTEYTKSLPFSIAYQNYEAEYKALPGKYAPPRGRLYIVYVDNKAAGCIALREFDTERCEMKRLYVRDRFRKLGLGTLLAEKIIADARVIGYTHMLLDSHETMAGARALYKRLGFAEIPPYNESPVPGTHYYALDLQQM